MFKKLVSIFLLLALISSNFSRYFVFASFQINKKYIANNLCENRARPQMHCNGKCYLMKKLKEAEENEKKQTQRNELKTLEIGVLQENVQLSFNSPTVENKLPEIYTFYNFTYISHYLDSVFRPPRSVA